MVCPYCHIEYATSDGFQAHEKSCFYKENPLPIPENENKQIKKVRKKSNTANKVGE